MSYFNFEKLVVWQEARELVKEIYRITANFPREVKILRNVSYVNR
ncbi:four helix bundle protein [Candidatus Curtissbacteria bacterium]|nr:four helix bundle protein [Candidatus Curtissbacteria bacterium]